MDKQFKDFTNVKRLNTSDKILAQQDSGAVVNINVGDLQLQTQVIVNDIGVTGQANFGVGIAPVIPVGLEALAGTTVLGSDQYGNYRGINNGSIKCWVPKHYVKLGANNSVDIKSTLDFADEAEANLAGYYLPRAFVDGGVIKDGVFVDKYDWSLTNFANGTSGMVTSVKGGNPISSSVETLRDATNNYAGSFSNCKSNSQTPENIYGGAWAAAKSEGNDFAVCSIFIFRMLAMLALAHAQASISSVNCAWYDGAGVTNFPKGNNSYGTDTNDNAIAYSACTDGYWAGRNEARKTGGTNTIAKTTHNGQNCGVADLNGNQYKIAQGLTCIATSKAISAITRATQAVFTSTLHGYSTGDIIMIDGSAATEWANSLQYQFCDVETLDANTFKLKRRNWDGTNYTTSYVDTSALTLDYTTGFSTVKGTFYMLKESIALKDVTGGSGATGNNHFGNSTIFDAVIIDTILVNKYATDGFGNGTNTVFAMNIDRANNGYRATNIGIPARAGISGARAYDMGQDMLYKFLRNELCVVVSGVWGDGSTAGVWCAYLGSARGDSSRSVSGRSCMYV